MKKILAVAAIENGTVIDHIAAGQALRVASFLRLGEHKLRVTIGLNLPSKSMGFKDLIKIEGTEVSEEAAREIAVFAPKATINIIRGFQLVKKFSAPEPEIVENVIECPNGNCITNSERVATRFSLHRFGNKVELCCYFCEKSFDHDAF